MAISPWTCFEQLTNDSLAVLNGGSVTVYLANTTTLVDLFTADDLTGAAANPITLDSAGRHAMRYFAAAKYKTLVKDSLGNTITTRDNIDPAVPLGSGTLAVANGGTGAATAGAARTNLGAASTTELADLAASIALSATATDKTHIATGTTAERPSVPAAGDIRRNTTKSMYEVYNGSAWVPWITAAADISSFTPTTQRLTSGTAATFTPAAGAVRWRVTMVGPGAGGGAQATNAGTAASGATTFQVNSTGTAWTAVQGSVGPIGSSNAAGGVGGTGGTDGTTGSLILRRPGSRGGPSHSTAIGQNLGMGGASALFANMKTQSVTGNAGTAAPTNSGCGGPGGGTAAAAWGGGAGGGETVEFWVTGMTTATYTIGTKGAGGAAGTIAGGDGADGIIIVEEFYF